MTNPKCSCGAPLVCFSELAGRDELLSAAKAALPVIELDARMAPAFYQVQELGRLAKALTDAIKLAESRHPVEVAK